MTKRKENYERVNDADVDIGDDLEAIPPLGDNTTTAKFSGESLASTLKAMHEAGGVDTPINHADSYEIISPVVAQNRALNNLIASGVITATDSQLTWRAGHLAHLAREYVADRERAWRDYSDDLTVVFDTDNAEFDALVAAARGE